MLAKKKYRVTGRGQEVLKKLLKDDISEVRMKLENHLLENRIVSLSDRGANGSYIRFDKVDQPGVIPIEDRDPICMVALQWEKSSSILLENPAGLLRALTSIDISSDNADLQDLLPILEARMPKAFRERMGRLRACDISDMSSNLVPLKLTLVDPGVQLDCRAWAEESHWLYLLEHRLIESLGPSDELSIVSKLPMPCRIGEIDITARQWQSLETGDVVFLDRASFDANGQGSMEFFGANYSVKFKVSEMGISETLEII